MSVYLGIDLGTQSLKALVYDAEAREIIASANSELRLMSRPDGSREQLASSWIEALHLALQQIDKKLRASIEAIGVSGQQHGFTPVDGEGAVLAPVKLWCDTATSLECDEITAAFGGADRCIREVGNPILPGYTASKILWLKKHKGAQYQKLRTVMLPHDYLNFYLTGERFTEHGDASGTGLLDIRNRCWHTEMLGAVDADRDLRLCMPALLPGGSIGGQLRSEIASLLKLPAGIPVSTGGGDNMMAAIGTGNVLPGRLTLSLGTSGTMFGYSNEPCIDEKGELAAFCSSTGGWLPLFCTMNCTIATELARGLFRLEISALEHLISTSRPGANGVVVLPFYNGERTPNLPNGKGCILGLDVDNMTQANILQASMEAVVFGLHSGLSAFSRVGCGFDQIRLTGGGSKSSSWRQMIADIFDLPVVTLALEEGAAMGAALNALIADQSCGTDPVQIASLIDQHIEVDESGSATPNPGSRMMYQESYGRYRQHLALMTPVFS